MMNNQSNNNSSESAMATRSCVGKTLGHCSKNEEGRKTSQFNTHAQAFVPSTSSLCKKRNKFVLPSKLEILPQTFKEEALSAIIDKPIFGNGKKMSPKKRVDNVFSEFARRVNYHNNFTLESFNYVSDDIGYFVTNKKLKYQLEIQADIDRITIDGRIFDFEMCGHFNEIVRLVRFLQNKSFCVNGKTTIEEAKYHRLKDTPYKPQYSYLEPQSDEHYDIMEQLQSTTDAIHDLIPSSHKEQIPMFFGFCVFAYQIYRSRNFVDICASIYCFFQNEHIPYKFNDIKDLVSFYYSSLSEQSGPLETLEFLNNSEFKQRSISLVNCLSAIYIGSGMGQARDLPFYRNFIRSNEAKLCIVGPDFLLTFLNNFSFIYARLTQFMQNKQLTTFYHDSDSYSEYFDLVLLLRRREPLLTNCEPHGFTELEYVNDICRCLRMGKEIISRLTVLRHKDLFKVKEMASSMESLSSRVHANTLASMQREMPFSLLIFGNTSIGKSTIVDAIWKYFSLIHPEKLEAEEAYRYDRNSDNDYWDNFKSTCWFIYMDDIAKQLPDSATGVDKSISELMSVSNCMPYVPVQAKLEDKGMTPLMNKLLIATTNVKDLNLWHYYTFPSAAARRFPFVVTPVVKKEFADTDGGLNSAACEQWAASHQDNTFPDFWTWCVDKVVPSKAANHTGENTKGRTMFRYHRILQNVDLKTFLEFLSIKIIEHHTNVRRMKESRKKLRSMTICPECQLPDGMCDHLREQSLSFLHDKITSLATPIANQVIDDFEHHSYRDQLTFRAASAFRNIFVGFCNFANVVATLGDITAVRNIVLSTSYLTSPYAALSFILAPISFSFSIMSIIYSVLGFFLLILKSFTIISNKIYKINHLQLQLTQALDNYKRFRSFTTKEFWKNLGKEISQSYKTPLAICSLALLVSVIYKIRSCSVRLSTQSDSFDSTDSSDEDFVERAKSRSKLKADRVTRDTPYPKDNIGITPFDAGKVTVSWKRFNENELMNLVQRNFYHCDMQYNSGTGIKHVTCSLICISSQYYIGNKHCFKHVLNDEVPCCKIVINNHTDATPLQIIITKDNIRSLVDSSRDLIMISCRSFNRHRSLLELIPTKDFQNAIGTGFMYHIGSSEKRLIRGKNLSYEDLTTINKDQSRYSIDGDHFWVLKGGGNGQKGWCGSPLFINTGYGTNLCGLHSLGGVINGEDVLVSTPIIREEMVRLISQFKDSQYMVMPGDRINMNNCINPIKNRISHIDYLEEQFMCNLSYFGSVTNRSSYKSNIRETPICLEIEQMFAMKCSKEAPDMSYRPFNLALRQHINGAQMPEAFMDDAKYDFLKTIQLKIPIYKEDYLSPLNLFENINGIPGCLFIDSINRRTSTGFPYNTTKKEFLNIVPSTQEYPDAVMPNQQILNDYQEMMKSYSRGERCYPVFRASLKDEPVTHEKKLIGKTRIFSGCPFAFTIIVREYFLPITKFIQEHRLIFEMAVGITSNSLEWDELAQHMLEKSHHFGGDFKRFDKGMQSSSIMVAMEFLIEIARIYGNYVESDLHVMFCVAVDLSKALVDFDGDILSFIHGNHSGHPLTVIVNCIVHSLYMRVCYKLLHPHQTLNSFSDNVTLITYGDDGMVGVDESTLWFNFESVSEILQDFNIGYTLPDKSERVVKFIPFNTLSFLKRTFLWDENLRCYLAPLEIDSIFHSLCIHFPSKSETIEHQLSSTITSASSEFFMYGEDKYNWFISEIRKIMKDYGIPEYHHMFATYDIEIKRFLIRKEEFMTPYHNELVMKIKDDSPDQISLVHPGDDGINYLERQYDAREYSQKSSLNRTYSIKDGKTFKKPDYFGLNDCVSGLTSPTLLKEVSNNLNQDVQCRSIQGDLTPQSGESGSESVNSGAPSSDYRQLVTEVTKDESVEQHQTVMYSDAKVGTVLNFNPIRDNSYYLGYTSSTELNNFFERPVRIKSYTWAEGAPLDFAFFPWQDYFTTPQVAKKLDNFALLSCNLHVKFMINASPFFYGMALASYAPLFSFSKHSFANVTGVDEIIAVPLSQRPHIYLYPANSQGGEMILPFISYKNWINVNKVSDFQEMGVINLIDIVDLLNSNGVSTANVTISVYAWAEDVRLCAPTTALAIQSDEYNGPISGPASAVARIAESMGRIPVIGRFATASAIGAGAVASIARMFGFTNVPVVEDQKPMMNQPFAHMASPEISTVVEKLTLDPKNELTIDPSTIGIHNNDELAIASIVQRESYVSTITWTTAQSPDTLLTIVAVTPKYIRTGSYGSVTTAFYTPSALVAEMFKFWRGTMKIRVKIICSKFHKGRIRLTWDPIGNLTTFTTDTSNLAFTRIIDITEEQDLTFEIPYVQDRAWLNTADTPIDTIGNSVTNVLGVTNGTFSIRVLNSLTAPVTSSSIRLVLFTCGGSDLEFSCPIEPRQTISYLTPQAGDDDIGYEGEYSTAVHMGIAKTNTEDDYLIYQGEVTRSLRQLIRRSNLMISLPCAPVGILAGTARQTFYLPRKILQYGYDTNALGITTKGILTPATQFPAIYARVTPLSLIIPCFVGQRGSYHYRINVDGHIEPPTISVERTDVNHAVLTPVVSTITTTATYDQKARSLWASNTSGSAGLSLTNGLTQMGMNVSVPMYSRYRIQSVDPLAIYGTNTPSDESALDTFMIDVTSHPAAQATDNLASTSVDVYACAGTDFNLFLFLNVPAIYYYTLPTP